MFKSTSVLIIIYTLLFSNLTHANELKSAKYNLSSPSEFVFESYPNQKLIPIRLLGAVKNAGLYHVPEDIKLTTLLTLAGGTHNDADIKNILIGNDQKKVMTGEGKEVDSLNLNLEDVLKSGAKNDYTLNANDIVLVKNKDSFISNDTFRTISIVSIVLTSLLTAVLIKDKLDD